jgi:hypothetical protein
MASSSINVASSL